MVTLLKNEEIVHRIFGYWPRVQNLSQICQVQYQKEIGWPHDDPKEPAWDTNWKEEQDWAQPDLTNWQHKKVLGIFLLIKFLSQKLYDTKKIPNFLCEVTLNKELN